MNETEAHRRHELRRVISQNRSLMPCCAAAVADYLDRLQAGSRVVLYGCGELASVLVEQHDASLRRHRPSFMETGAEDIAEGAQFFGHPKHGLGSLADSVPDVVIVLSYAFRLAMLRRLGFLPRERVLLLPEIVERCEDLAIFDNARRKLDGALQAAIAPILALRRRHPKLLCFATQQPAHHLLKILYEMKQRGHAVVLFVEKADITERISLEDFEGRGYFDALYVSQFSFSLELLALSEAASIDILHVETGMWPSLSLQYVLENKPCPTVVEYRDFKQIVFADDPSAMQTLELSPNDFAKEKLAQRRIYTLADGVLYKDSPEILEHLALVYGHRPPHSLHFVHYLCEAFSATEGDVAKLSEQDGALHLVYAGNIVNEPAWHNYPIFASLLEAARVLDSQGIHLTLYNANDSSGEGFEEYVELASELEHFHYHFAVPYDELKRVLPRHDYGWFCFDFRRARENPFFLQTTMGSKVFSYLEAGLPILVSPEQHFISHIVRSLGIGVPIEFTQLGELAACLATIDPERQKRTLERARSANTYDRNADQLIDFYRDVVGGWPTQKWEGDALPDRSIPIAPPAAR